MAGPAVPAQLERALDQVDGRVADQRRHVAVHRLGIEPVGGVDLGDLPVLDHGDALADAERLELVGRGIDRGRAELAVQALELGPHVVAELGIEVGERLVEEEEPRLADDGAPDGEPLLLAAAERCRLALQRVGDAQKLRRLAHARVGLGAAQLHLPQRVSEILIGREVRIEGEALEDHRHVAALDRDSCEVVPVDHERAGVRLLEAGDDAERRRLSGRARPEQDEELAVLDLQVDAAERVHRAVALGQPREAKLRHSTGPLRRVFSGRGAGHTRLGLEPDRRSSTCGEHSIVFMCAKCNACALQRCSRVALARGPKRASQTGGAVQQTGPDGR